MARTPITVVQRPIIWSGHYCLKTSGMAKEAGKKGGAAKYYKL